MGYVHKDLKPDNIMVNLDPLEVKIIDFNRVNLTSSETERHVRGATGYFADRKKQER